MIDTAIKYSLTHFQKHTCALRYCTCQNSLKKTETLYYFSLFKQVSSSQFFSCFCVVVFCFCFRSSLPDKFKYNLRTGHAMRYLLFLFVYKKVIIIWGKMFCVLYRFFTHVVEFKCVLLDLIIKAVDMSDNFASEEITIM